jgi:hypothetical protein
MYRYTIFVILIVLVLFFAATSVFSFTDVCDKATEAYGMTTAQMKDFYERNLQGRRVEGDGKIYDVLTTPGYGRKDTIIILKCQPFVFIKVYAGVYRGRIKDLMVGQHISFTGECRGLYWKYYRDSDKRYIEARVNSAYLRY